MSNPVQENQVPVSESPKSNEKELNFRMLESKYQKQLEQERAARLEAERRAKEMEAQRHPTKDEEEDDEPYVDRKKLNRELGKVGERWRQEASSEIQKAVQQALSEERKQNWIKQNPDFYEILQHADKFASKDPELAESILEMPDGFERQKLVYKTIKAMGVHKPEVKESPIQQKIDQNRRSPFYQPTGVGTAPYQSSGDFSPAGQKSAYEKMQQLKNNLRLG